MFLSAKKWLIPLLLLTSVWSAQASDQLLRSLQPRGMVNDFANVIPPTQEQQLEQMLVSLERQTGAQVAVVTITSLEGGQIDDFAVHLYERWNIGQAGKDNGVLLLAAINDRKARIEVGYGLEGAITDARAGQILRETVFPAFKQGQYGTGMIAGASRISERVAAEYGVTLQQATGPTQHAYANQQQSSRKRGNPLVNLLLFIGFIYMAIRHPHLLLLMLMSSGRGGRSSHSSGGFGGGFGGFGGGSSGGGGASGGW